MADADRGRNKGDTLSTVLILYFVVSILALVIATILAAMTKDTNSSIYTIWGPMSLTNVICSTPCIVILITIISYKKIKANKAQKNDASKVIGTGIPAQNSMRSSHTSKPGMRNDGIVKAEEDREIWTFIVQLKESDLDSRISAVRELRKYNTPEVEENLTKAMFEDKDLSVRLEAYLALKFQGKDKIDLLLDRLKAAGDTNAMLELLELLRKIGDERQTNTLTYLYDFETDKAVKIGILDTLSKFCSPEIKDLACSILRKEDDKEIRINALEALCWYDDEPTRDILKHLLDDPDADIRDRACKMLNSIELRT